MLWSRWRVDCCLCRLFPFKTGEKNSWPLRPTLSSQFLGIFGRSFFWVRVCSCVCGCNAYMCKCAGRPEASRRWAEASRRCCSSSAAMDLLFGLSVLETNSMIQLGWLTHGEAQGFVCLHLCDYACMFLHLAYIKKMNARDFICILMLLCKQTTNLGICVTQRFLLKPDDNKSVNSFEMF